MFVAIRFYQEFILSVGAVMTGDLGNYRLIIKTSRIIVLGIKDYWDVFMKLVIFQALYTLEVMFKVVIPLNMPSRV